MKILAISGILPIPGLINGNDFIYCKYSSLIQQFPESHVVIIRPTQYKSNIKKIYSGRTDLDKLKGARSLSVNNFRVEIYPFLSSWKIRDLHAILCNSILLFSKKRLDKLIQEHRFDIVHAQYIFPDGLLALYAKKKYNIPYVITTHKEHYFLKFPISRNIAKIILRNANRILPINYQNFKRFKCMGLNKIEVLPLGFSSTFFRTQKKVCNERIKIITVSSLLPYKNVNNVIFAIARLVKKYPISYTVIGCGPEKEKLLSLVKSNGIEEFVNFPGSIPNDLIADEIFKHDIFILTSYIETFGRVYFEAMAMGIPIICSKNSGIYGYYKDMEEGLTVIHSDIDDIADKLEKLITQKELRIRVGKRGQRLVKAYSWKNVAKRNHQIYQEVINEHRSHLFP